ncbi:MAG TPA: HlyD family efflux transporter periplasmic adaptor subunit [Chloroflexi bacterium]|nr:HlyD family efflux transporter periplasmic adaptor subunit [Chloroflexota bacterium]
MRLTSWLFGASAIVLACAGCTQPAPTVTPAPTATPIPPIALVRTTGGNVTASANVAPAQSANLALPAAGRVAEVFVAVGDSVPAGAPLVRLDTAAAEIALTQARAAYFRAQAQLAELQADPVAAQVAAAQAQVAAAQARLAQLTDPPRPADIAAAEAELAAAQAAYQALFAEPDEGARISALAALANARAAVQQAQAAFNEVKWRNDAGALPQSRQLQEATNNLEAAQARYDALFADPTAAAIAAASARIAQAKATLDRLQAPATAAQLAEAQAQVDAALAQLATLTDGARSETVAVAAGAVAEARAAVQRAEQSLADLTLRAPFSGVVTAVNVAAGEFVMAGTPVATLAALDTLRIETVDLSERDIAFVSVGQPARVLIEPLAVTLPGRVARIAPQPSTIGGDVVYTVWIDLDEQPPALRWGMSAEVTIGE